ncbi:hypothetical protein GOODEAATRI_025863 [Goodea atripinnis]|uniref:Uncharacterized protein n=1 Tax=Goodea atripinnis TaxID=208336 RepID=A0ABV0NNL3_9TELE
MNPPHVPVPELLCVQVSELLHGSQPSEFLCGSQASEFLKCPPLTFFIAGLQGSCIATTRSLQGFVFVSGPLFVAPSARLVRVSFFPMALSGHLRGPLEGRVMS